MDATRQALIDAIYGQESSHGKADTSQENYAGARGPMQVTASTFDGLKNKGIIPKNYDHANPEHSKAAGVALVNYLADKYAGDPSKVAAAYYAGEKAVRADGTIADFRDLKNSKAPTTLQYVSQVLGRMNGEQAPAAAAPTGAGAKPSVLDAWETGFGDRPDKIGSLKAALPTPVVADTALPQGPSSAHMDAVLAGEANKAQAQEVLDTSFGDTSRALFMHTGFLGTALKRISRDSFGAPVPGFKIDPKEYDGMTDDEQAALSTAYNQPMLDKVKSEIEMRREDMRTGSLNGPWVSTAASILGTLPEGYATGALGSLAAVKTAAQLGVRTRAGLIGMAAAENVGGNVALTAAQAAIDPYTGHEDGAMAVGMGLLGTAMHLPGIGRAADRAHVEFQANRIMRSAAEEAEKVEKRALDNLGQGASREQVQAEIDRLQADDAKAKVQTATAPLPESRRLLPREEEPNAVAASFEDWSRVEPTPRQAQASERPMFFDEVGSPQTREWMARNDEGWKANLAAAGEGVTMAQIDKLPNGVHVRKAIAADVTMGPTTRALTELAAKILPDAKIILGKAEQGGTLAESAAKSNGGTAPGNVSGVVISAGNVHVIGLSAGNPTKALTTGIHELGHAVLHQELKNAPRGLLQRMADEHQEFIKELKAGNPEARFKRFSEGSDSMVPEGTRNALPDGKYTASFDEYGAEAFVRFVQRRTREGQPGGIEFDKGAIALLKGLWEKVKTLYNSALKKGYLSKDEAFDEFFDRVLQGTLKDADRIPTPQVTEFMDPSLTINFSHSVGIDPIANKYGLDMLPQTTAQERAEFKAVRHLYERADGWAAANPKDEAKLSKLMDTAVFQNGQSITSTMLRSDNPVVRMIASELMESASGAGGRRSNAAIAKHIHERAFVGNTINEVQSAYGMWRKDQGGTVIDDFMDGKLWQQFNRNVAEEIEYRKLGNRTSGTVDPNVAAAANSVEASYERMRVAQQSAKTVGWAALPESSVGYMPHKMSAEKVRQLTNEQADTLRAALADQFISIEGFDISFAANLATKYVDRIKRRALGGAEAPANIHQTGAADVVEEALGQMGMSKPEIEAAMQRYMRGGAGHTKQRLKLDLNAVHANADGTSFRLLDLFETDQLQLLRNQAGRVSGEVALAGHGVMGKPGLALLRRAMEFGESSGKAQGRELEAFDQMAAEMLGDPFGTAHSAKWMNRAMQVTSLARLGGMGFTQLAESINAIAHVGASRALASVGGLNRLRREAAALARGEQVDNPILASIEKMSGAEFGTDNRKMVFPFDNQSLQYQSYGKDTVTMADRVLRGATHLQGKLSLWQAIHGAQQRGMAEQIVSKAAEYIKAGKNDVALRDMGISDDLAARLRGSLDKAATFNGSKLESFDITKIEDTAAANEFVQAIHRGTSQIIQDTFIGERSKWAHDATARVFTQFRTFSLTSVEKQWGRQVNNHGQAKAFGILLGSMSVAAPIYIARTYAQSIGRKDQEAYLDKMLTPYAIGRATMNYVAASGLAGDFLDATTAFTGLTQVGGRAGAAKSFVGNVIAPSAGLIDDAWKAVQNDKDGVKAHDLAKVLPFSNLPMLMPAVNSLD